MARPGAGMDVDLTLNRRSLGLSDAGGVAARGSMPVSAHAWRARLLVEAGLESRPQDALLSGLVELGARLDGGDASASRTPASAWSSRPSAGT